MVSFLTPLSPTQRKAVVPELENVTKKRKWEEPEAEDIFGKPLKATTRSMFDTELHLETPLPLDWQRCLDIKSGQIHYYNMTTQKRTSKDPRIIPEPPSPGHMSLDLELNLPCGSPATTATKSHDFNSGSSSNGKAGNPFLNYGENKKNSGGLTLTRSPSWLAFEGDQNQIEMITGVCKKCHMLVMMCKSSPACPNCKFMHPPDQSPPNQLKPRLSLLC